MANLDLARLKALAEQAKPDAEWWTHDELLQSPLVLPAADGAFIAACSPDVILSLIARLEKVERFASNPPPLLGRDGADALAEVLCLLREEEQAAPKFTEARSDYRPMKPWKAKP